MNVSNLQIARQSSEFSTKKSVTLSRYAWCVQPLLEDKKFQRSGHRLLYDSRCQRQFLFLNPFCLLFYSK